MKLRTNESGSNCFRGLGLSDDGAPEPWATWSARFYRMRLQPYLVTILLALAAIPIGLEAGPVFAAGTVILAVLALLNSRHLLHEIQSAGERGIVPDDNLCKSQIFSSVDELAAGIAHEINNPVGIISQETEWMQHLLQNPSLEGIKEAEELNDSLREICCQVDRCKEIVQKLLSLARQMEPVLQVVDINALLRNMIDIAKKCASERNINITERLEPDLPVVSSDPPLLRQVFLNLLFNATQAIERDGEILVTTTRGDKDLIEVSVEDSGCGIPKEHLTKVFTPYFSTKPVGKGTGLGLAISRGIIERLGGHIAVRSEVGKCTVFTIRIPVNARAQGTKGERRA